jgi:hypothetical protein
MAGYGPTPGVVVVLDPRLDGWIERTTRFDPELEAVADDAATFAFRLARTVAWRSGDYGRSISATVTYDDQGFRVGRMGASDWKTHWVERGWTQRGGRRHPGKHVLERGWHRTGLPLDTT